MFAKVVRITEGNELTGPRCCRAGTFHRPAQAMRPRNQRLGCLKPLPASIRLGNGRLEAANPAVTESITNGRRLGVLFLGTHVSQHSGITFLWAEEPRALGMLK
jgi:hypothetical protein